MPSGGITITPGYQLGPGEKVNNTKLNQGFQPIGQVNAGAITERELDDGIMTIINGLKGRNILCNGSFQIWNNINYTGLVAGGYSHDYGSAARWVVANDANRAVTRQQFAPGSTEIPNGVDFLRWIQSANVGPNPAYLGQRFEDVRRFSGVKAAFSIYLRASANLSVTPKLRQVFGATKRTIQATLGHISGSGIYTDGARSFKASDVGAAIVVTGPSYGPITTTIVTFSNEGAIVVADTSGATVSNGLTGVITSPAGSDSVITAGPPLPLTAGQWAQLVQVFDVPSVTGKTIVDARDTFTEFRVDVPQGISFQIDFANAQLENATGASPFERRLIQEDLAYARYYFETKYMTLSNTVTVWKPFISLTDKRIRPTTVLSLIEGGTGGAVELRYADTFVTQYANHSAILNALVTADAEIRD